MKKRIKYIISLLLSVCMIFMTVPANAKEFVNIRTVCDMYNSDFEIPYLVYGNVRYLPAYSGEYLCQGMENVVWRTTYGYPIAVSMEQRDVKTGKASYFTIWDLSNKLRIQGHDDLLLYPAFMGYMDDGTMIPWISLDDTARIYGFDINYWAEKNTLYLTHNGKGILQKYL